MFGTEEDKINFLTVNSMDRHINGPAGVPVGNYMTNYITLQKNATQIHSIMDEYDFIGVAERFDESMAVLSALANVPLSDVLYTSSLATGSAHREVF